jgi:hypothetical protein
MAVREKAFEILGLPQPHEETLHCMKKTLGHNKPIFMNEMVCQMRHLEQHFKTIGRPAEITVFQIGKLSFSSQADNFEGDAERRQILAKRLRFVMDHPGCERLFTPHPEEDETLSRMRHIIQNSMNMTKTDDMLKAWMGAGPWSEFVADPDAFISSRIDRPRVREEMIEPDSQIDQGSPS